MLISVQTKDYLKIELFVFDRNNWNHLTVWKKVSLGSFKDVIYKMC